MSAEQKNNGDADAAGDVAARRPLLTTAVLLALLAALRPIQMQRYHDAIAAAGTIQVNLPGSNELAYCPPIREHAIPIHWWLMLCGDVGPSYSWDCRHLRGRVPPEFLCIFAHCRDRWGPVTTIIREVYPEFYAEHPGFPWMANPEQTLRSPCMDCYCEKIVDIELRRCPMDERARSATGNIIGLFMQMAGEYGLHYSGNQSDTPTHYDVINSIQYGLMHNPHLQYGDAFRLLFGDDRYHDEYDDEDDIHHSMILINPLNQFDAWALYDWHSRGGGNEFLRRISDTERDIGIFIARDPAGIVTAYVFESGPRLLTLDDFKPGAWRTAPPPKFD